jgi:hypothetical protein
MRRPTDATHSSEVYPDSKPVSGGSASDFDGSFVGVGGGIPTRFAIFLTPVRGIIRTPSSCKFATIWGPFWVQEHPCGKSYRIHSGKSKKALCILHQKLEWKVDWAAKWLGN